MAEDNAQKQEIDVRQVMADIKAEAEARYTSDQLSYFDIEDARDVLTKYLRDNGVFSHEKFIFNFQESEKHRILDYYHPVGRNVVDTFVRKVFRKIGSAVVLPLFEEQNEVNKLYQEMVYLLYARTNSMERSIEDMEAELAELEALESALKRLNELEAKLSQTNQELANLKGE